MTYGRIWTGSLLVFASLSSLVLLYCISTPFPATRQLRTTSLTHSEIVTPMSLPPTPSIVATPPQKPTAITTTTTQKKRKSSVLAFSATNKQIMHERMNFMRSHAIAMPRQERPISHSINVTTTSSSTFSVPFVIMAYNRLNYLQQSIDSILKSDFPRQSVPLIVSVDGHIPEVLQYLETIRTEFPLLQVWIHPFACWDHPHDFPMQVTTPDFGDTYGNPRTPEITCCKHHFTWMLQQVFTKDDELKIYESFLFLEEDYIVAPTVYETIQQGIHAMTEFSTEAEFLGIVLDPTNGGVEQEPVDLPDHIFYAHAFRTGPMTLNRNIYQKLVQSAHAYCTMDESNWDWSLVHMMLKQQLPHTVFFPSRSQVRHIGLHDGMHEHSPLEINPDPLSSFHATAVYGPVKVATTVRPRQVTGGWGHIMDHDHCLQLLAPTQVIQTE